MISENDDETPTLYLMRILNDCSINDRLALLFLFRKIILSLNFGRFHGFDYGMKNVRLFIPRN